MNDKISHDSNQIEVGINIKKGEFVFLIIILFLFPISVFIIQQFTIFEGKFLEYIILIIYLPIILIYNKLPLSIYGIKKAELKESLKANIFPTLIGVILVLIVIPISKPLLNYESITIVNSFSIWIIWYALISAFIQEFIFRGIIQTRLSSYFNNPKKAILISSIGFALSHLPINWFLVLLVVIPGFALGYSYEKAHNLIGVTVSHIIIGVFAVILLI
ncbi:MAG: CPBP family intramembrane glutamic endopeptidase [Promethearchaeota archaeon]